MAGHRFEVPSHYRHIEVLTVRYARWDLTRVLLVDPHSDQCLETLYPQDKLANADAKRRVFKGPNREDAGLNKEVFTGVSPLLKQYMAEYAATGLPPAYITKGE